jgi:hypothetical protein
MTTEGRLALPPGPARSNEKGSEPIGVHTPQ